MCCSTEVYSREHYIDEDLPAFQNSPLIRPQSCHPESDPDPDTNTTAVTAKLKPDLEVLRLHAPRTRSGISEESIEEARSSSRAMSAPPEPPRTDEVASSDEKRPPPKDGTPESSLPSMPFPPDQDEELKKTAALAIQETDRTLQDVDTPERVDSGRGSQENVAQVDSEPSPPLKLRVEDLALSASRATANDDSIANSPILRKNMVQIEPTTTHPSVQPTSPMYEGSGAASRKESLPGFQELANLADIASQQANQQSTGAQPMARAHSHSISSATSASPMLPYHPPSYANSAQTSPVSYHAFSAKSPISTASDGTFNYGSPFQGQPQAYYADRRSSIATESGRLFPRQVPSLPSNSSSGESHGTTGSSTDGYSTSHTTPLDGSVESMQTRILPPPIPGMVVSPVSGFKCDWPGCTAQSFQTQYLLSSHRNVHSQNRPHYCPVKDCPRSEGGNGFKRKNEMIRHGLVHKSPGYICPFCPDREHRYPRPDNLQRHVRVHHVDKDRDDPALREVLARRSEGSVQKQRRRRAHGNNSTTESS